MIRFVTGNLLDAKADALVNTVNTVGVMGKGIALQFKEAFLNNYKIYKDACKNGVVTTGELLVVKDQNAILGEKLIVNFPTKKHWKQPSRYEYIEAGLQELARYIDNNDIKSIALPPLGCGNGGLDWSIVKPMIEKYLANSNADIYVYEPNSAVKTLLQKQETTKKVKLTSARAMLLYALFHYEALGEYSSLFSANKLAYFLQRIGEDLKLKFEAHIYGPYALGVEHVLYALNGTYLNGLEQREAKAFESLKLNYDKFEEVKAFVNNELNSEQKKRLKNLIEFINGFESELSLEVLASVAYLLDKNPGYSLTQTIDGIFSWNDRKRKLFKERYIEIAYNHVRNNSYQQELFN
ncbi:macro domain-containing protein [Mucilaginibacter sp. FT3.2]|uniref:type II toxin-antitoxin system antitoxin DNA ADP-ribosyl glycohydrolase DarG n=1 Tax=Mucilaginibacter sp. FT3.2 TaxID=2723090 RepID=UPI0017D35EC4|nr:macro domain-containing protein [Mucilaginibacter sp. FT3.2]MBB6232188.1 O-acetyl-ADP-ribose deacetylase (regulator of RNase III) [Mucilaginibacter sp. FT3.2]